ncbi:MAG: hypothetical protein IKC22_00590 [Bacilli bacterium]|nr:hypothetical protein [bacterium]MBR2890879.1 hypothetical protein [Bacilli bacterium]
MNNEEIIANLKTLKNSIELEKMTLPSLQYEELNEENINKFVDTMTRAFNNDIILLNNIVATMESKSESDGK